MAMRTEGPTLHIDLDEIGGGKVVWPFSMNGKRVPYGTELTAEQINAHLISLLSGYSFPVLPKLFPVNFHRESHQNASRLLH